MAEIPRMSIEEARISLERLRDITHFGDPYQLAPVRWLAELHAILDVIATREAQRVYRLDHLTGVHVGYLHQRVLDVLRDFDRLVAERNQTP